MPRDIWSCLERGQQLHSPVSFLTVRTTNMVMPTSSRELERVIRSQLDETKDARLSDHLIESLLLTCGDSMLLAALDLIDSREGKFVPAQAQCHCWILANAGLMRSLDVGGSVGSSTVPGATQLGSTRRTPKKRWSQASSFSSVLVCWYL